MARAPLIKDILRPILKSNDDLILVEKSIVFRPVHHVMRSIRFEYGRFHSGDIDVHKCYSELFGEQLHFPLPAPPLFYRVDPPDRQGWVRSRADHMELLPKIIQDSVIPYMRTLDDLDQYAEAHNLDHNMNIDNDLPERPKPLRFYILNLPCLVARGKLEFARRVARERVVRSTYGDSQPSWLDESAYTAIRRLCDLLERDDRAGMVEVLHQLEEMTVTKSGFAHLWERTPFPLERML